MFYGMIFGAFYLVLNEKPRHAENDRAIWERLTRRLRVEIRGIEPLTS